MKREEEKERVTKGGPDLVVSAKTDPLGNRLVAVASLGELGLGHKRFLGRLSVSNTDEKMREGTIFRLEHKRTQDAARTRKKWDGERKSRIPKIPTHID